MKKHRPEPETGRLLTITEVYDEYRISPASCYRMFKDGRLKSVRIAGRRLVPREVLEQMISEQLTEVRKLAPLAAGDKVRDDDGHVATVLAVNENKARVEYAQGHQRVYAISALNRIEGGR